MSAPDYEAMANGLDEVWAGSATITSAGARDAAAALRRAARIEAAAKEAVQMFRAIDGFGPSETIEKLREALEEDTE